jgi:hypothetical protein
MLSAAELATCLEGQIYVKIAYGTAWNYTRQPHGGQCR